MNETNAAKDAQIAALTEQVAKLTARIEELTHKKNSKNSSKPPSEGRLEKPATKSLRGKSGKKPSFDACLSLRNGSALALVESWQD